MFDLNALVRENIRSLVPYSSARSEFSGEAKVYLDANENPNGELNRYPDPIQHELRNRLAQLNDVDTPQVFVGNGSDEVIDLLFRIFCRPSLDRVLVLPPTYGMYAVSAAVNDVAVIEVPLNSEYDIDLVSTLRAIELYLPKLIFLCSPNNPTGNTLSLGCIKRIAEASEGLVVVDEAYIEFSATASLATQLGSLPNLVIMRTLSKYWGLAGARIGYALASESIIALLDAVKPPYNVSSLNQQSALETLSKAAEAERVGHRITKERSRLRFQLSQLDNVRRIYPSEANFLLVEFANADAVYDSLLQNKIIVRNRSNVVPNCLRITVGTQAENDALLSTLAKLNDEKSTVYR
ncbi:histidinol-phosphate transaminase [Phaeocystidibacter luteus]|uniref:Histidinol-phosphate aminotransferase n=1 Tax=Phaeocystidibacter luteus TaxID=911197 RepID=A0A6N6RGN8_9FLAO|nr:histidinol-phosphate transaminase [Phaeocystidibacter luteus]KAB2807733.1 histidinol-phosphate transaminase [Phaeocystidibacter luteus]